MGLGFDNLEAELWFDNNHVVCCSAVLCGLCKALLTELTTCKWSVLLADLNIFPTLFPLLQGCLVGRSSSIGAVEDQQPTAHPG